MKTISLPNLGLVRTPFQRMMFRENTVEQLNAEVWAREALLELQGAMVLGNIAYKDYSDQVARYGDTVNVPRPGVFSASRKGALCEEIVQQDYTDDSFQVALDQFIYVSFKICDGEENRPMQDLIDLFLRPAVLAFGKKIDLVLGGQHIRFWNNFAGHLGLQSTSNIQDYLVDTREVMNLNGAPDNRNMALAVKTESTMLKADLFVSVNRSGSTNALRKGEIGQLFGFNLFSALHQPQIATGQAAITGAVNNAGGYPPGATSITYDGAVGTFTAGLFITIVGDDTPLRVTAATGTVLTLEAPGTRRAVADNAVITAVKAGAVNKAGGYIGNTYTPHRKVGYSKYLITDGWTAGTRPQVGQPVAFGTDDPTYSIIDVLTTNSDLDKTALPSDSYAIQLDRPLDLAVADNATVNLGPAGSYNFAFTDNALAAAFRPLPKPRVGALSAVREYKNIPIRVVISYDPKQQAHVVTLDTLMGIGTYDIHTGAVMYG